MVKTSWISANDAGSTCGSNAPIGNPAICPIEKYINGSMNTTDATKRINSVFEWSVFFSLPTLLLAAIFPRSASSAVAP